MHLTITAQQTILQVSQSWIANLYNRNASCHAKAATLYVCCSKVLQMSIFSIYLWSQRIWEHYKEMWLRNCFEICFMGLFIFETNRSHLQILYSRNSQKKLFVYLQSNKELLCNLLHVHSLLKLQILYSKNPQKKLLV